MKLYYCDAPTGSGKTYAIERKIADLLEIGQTVILVQPTKALAEQTRLNIQMRFAKLHVEILNGDTVEGSAIRALTEYLNKPFDGPHLIITTWASFIAVPYVARRSRFHLILDEVPSGFETFSKRLPDNHDLITSKVMLEPVNEKWARVVGRCENDLRIISENPRIDEATKIIKPIAEMIYRGKYDAFVEIEPYNQLLKGSKDNRWLKTYSVIKKFTFEDYASVTILGARAKETILFQLLEKQGVSFVEDADIRRSLRYTSHENGHLIDFYYAFDQSWSLNAQNNDPEMRNLYEKAVIDLFEGKDFCWLDNKDYEKSSPFCAMEGSNKLPHSSHGLNGYMGTDNAAIMAVTNYAPDQARFLADMQGIDRKSQKIALDYHSTYQAYCRTSVRDMSNKKRKIIVLPDRENGAWQHQLFPGSSLNSLGLNWQKKQVRQRGPTRKHMSDADRQRAYRERKKIRDREAGEAGEAREA